MRLARSVIVTVFEDVSLSDKADAAIEEIDGRFSDKRTKRGKIVARLSDAVAELSEVAYILGLDSACDLFPQTSESNVTEGNNQPTRQGS
jgi:hypothetical protein